MKRYEVLDINDGDIERILRTRLGNLVEMVGRNARVIVRDGDRDRLIEIPTAFWKELKEAE